ncbi:hypothetical protein JTB14_000501 [Gonioctena quinquepunctata]|nr:hypothetical protein JTB14_000501 [Gonioctena quinquepunctata]
MNNIASLPRKNQKNRSAGPKTPDDVDKRVSEIEKNLGHGIDQLKNQLLHKLNAGNIYNDDIGELLLRITAFENLFKNSLELKLELKSHADHVANIYHNEKSRNAIIINNIPEVHKENIVDTALTIIQKCLGTVTLNDINYCYKMGNNSSTNIAVFL